VARSGVDDLLDRAEAEFAGAGFQHGSLRKIMREAGADPGAVHYHFGSREALAAAVLDRILGPLNARRLDLLDAAAAQGSPRTSQLVEALIRPDIEAGHALHAQSPGRARLIGAIYTRPADFVSTTVAAHFAPVADAFRPHLEAALPHLRFETVAWRIRWCVFGPVGALLADESAAFDRPPDDLVTELVHTLSAALTAPA
jgi:AcrR family transcriptional regulator